MAITTNAITNSFKEDILQGIHDFTVSTGDTFKLALYIHPHPLVLTLLHTQ
jgi:hypothetical protein